MMLLEDTQNSITKEAPVPVLPIGPKVWKPFPSVHLPSGFNASKVEEYFKRLPRITYSNTEGILTAVRSDESDSGSDEQSPASDFDNLCRRAMLRCIVRGERYLNSGHVLSVLDCIREDHYFVKGQIQASMRQELRTVTSTVNKHSGDVCTATCTCKAKALNRCGHIAALQCLVVKHIATAGLEAVTATGRPCYWVLRPPGRDPGFREKTEYRGNERFIRRVTFITSPTSFLQPNGISPERKAALLKNLKLKRSTSRLFLHLEPPSTSQDCSIPQPPQEEKLTEADVEAAAEKCSEIFWLLNQTRKVHDSPFQVPGTEDQRNSEKWRTCRTYRCSASSCKLLLGLKECAKVRQLRSHVWDLNRVTTWEMQYGIDHEDEARAVYEKFMQEDEPDASVQKCGLWINPKYPQLCCSPDGILVSPSRGRVLVEIKCLTLPYVDPNYFEDQMPQPRVKIFYLKRRPDGTLALKETHAYHYQIQMCLDILELETAHLFVWSESGFVVCEVRRNESFFNEKRARLITYHRSFVIPELILRRALRNLSPVEMHYQRFHEDENDPYFLEHGRLRVSANFFGQ